MLTKYSTVVLLGLVLVAAAACSGSDGLSKAEEDALQKQAEEAQKAAEEAQKAAEAAQKAAEEAERKRQEAERERAAEEEQREAAEEQQRAAEAERQRLAEEAEEAQRRLTEAEQAELRARASSFATALDAPGAESATVSWPRGGSLTFRPSGVTHTPGSAAPSVPGGWRSASFTGQTGTAGSLVDETVYLYTNIQKAGSKAFWKKYGGEAVSISAGELSADHLAKPSTSVSRTRSDPNDNTSAYVSATTGGTYDGVSGEFSCTGDETGCTVTKSGGTTTIVGTWTFEATNPKSGAPVDHDDAYLYFGIWSSIPDSISGDHDFEYIAGGGRHTGTELTGFASLTGSATFRGGAVGRYVTQGQVGGQNAKIGTFTATATLNADFGDGDTAGTLSGSITNFREGGSSLAGWRVTLGRDDNVGAASDITLAAAGTDDVTGDTLANIGGLSVGGEWGAKFHGSANVITGLEDRNKYPAVDLAGVAGWFDATGTSASLAGAFAATPQ